MNQKCQMSRQEKERFKGGEVRSGRSTGFHHGQGGLSLGLHKKARACGSVRARIGLELIWLELK
jgi:hypothetical protein